MKSKAVEAIYPLTFLQQQLLLHSLSNEEDDQGFIQVTCKILGPLQLELFKASWQSVVKLHGAFRTSIHWEDLEKPVQVIHRNAELSWQYLDLSHEKGEQKKLVEDFLRSDKELGINFLKAPISRCAILKLRDDEHILVWSCHHILFDGWSGKIALEHVLKAYDAWCRDDLPQPVNVPDHQSYLNWIAKQGVEKAQKFWSEYLDKFEERTLVGPLDNEATTGYQFKEQHLIIPEANFKALMGQLKHHRVTLSTFVSTTWGLLLGIINGSQDVVFGSTVAGRSMGFPHLENMIGLFMNVLPIRVRVDPMQTYAQFMQANQKQQLQAFEFAYVNQDSINSWIEGKSKQQLFDSLVLTQNHMADDIKSEQLTVTDLKGRVTSTQALTVIAQPGQNLHITLRYNGEVVHPSLIEWISKSFKAIALGLIDQKQVTVDELQATLEDPPAEFNVSQRSQPLNVPSEEHQSTNYVPPTNSLELELTKIWEENIGQYPIGIDDNFFEIGGDSFMALQLISAVDTRLNKKLSPTTLIQYPTIRSMVSSWESEADHQEFPSLVPIRARGHKPPLFVIHGGGGHVFFYYPLAKHMDEDQPVYALQPVGLFGESEMHKSIKAMADHYLATIKSIVPKGPFSILGTCLSDPICVEINKSLRKQGEAPMAMVIVDSAPLHLLPRKRPRATFETRISRFKKRYQESAARAVKKIFVGRYKKAIRPLKHKFKDLSIQYGSDEQARNLLDIQRNLRKLYGTYKWEPFEGRVTLIKAELNKSWDEEIWQSLAKDGVKIIKIPGPHISRFDEPQVISMAKSLQKELDELHLNRSGVIAKNNPIYQTIR